MGETLNEEFGQYGYRPNVKKLYYFVAWLASFVMPEAKAVIGQWGIQVKTSNQKIKNNMDMEFRDMKDTIKEMGYSLIEQGFVEDKR
mmetsp:Transcript_9805/g.8634  ORF Transcript_9805/g.8634 Transcript_9805/m.8634 type:complete len:87 (+) Transcript_9805:383-643(+)